MTDVESAKVVEPVAAPAAASPVPATIVICARNRAAMIDRCLDSVLAAHPAETIVVDGNSTDGTAEIARARGVTVVSDNGAGLAAARQLGARLAQHDYVIFVDTDVVVAPDTFRQMLDEAKEQGYDALEAELRTLSPAPSYWQRAERWRRTTQMRKGVAAVLGCQITLVRRELLMRVGFDAAFEGAAEDADFCFRARATGAVIAHSARAVAYHEDRHTLREFMLQKVWHGRGLARLYVRYRRRYLQQAAQQVNNSVQATKINVRYLPYIVTNWGFTALGVGLEMLRILGDRDLRRQLAAGQV
jgi:GT2 family glycosyltransferase